MGWGGGGCVWGGLPVGGGLGRVSLGCGGGRKKWFVSRSGKVVALQRASTGCE